MSIVFGVTDIRNQRIEEQLLSRLAEATRRFAPDGSFLKAVDNVGMGFQPYYTHERSRLDSLPATHESGNILSFDGRLDNYRELCEMLSLSHEVAADSEIILRAFDRWKEACFARFVGDWSLALWCSRESALYLARDHAGTRPLYFEQADSRVMWSTSLETFFADGECRALDEEFAIRYLAFHATRELTPFKGIKAVPPAHFVRFRHGEASVQAHWRWVRRHQLRFKSDSEYEERFLHLFRQSVSRRTGPGAPILAQLSGGMDSTSIVCASDQLRRSSQTSVELLDTVSFYDNSEPTWDEVPFFTAVEAARGKSGIHIDASFSSRTMRPRSRGPCRQVWPGEDQSWLDLNNRFHDAIRGSSYRVILSGLGGDEVLGGVPAPAPELADHLMRGHPIALWRSTVQWCLAKRVPMIWMIADVLRFTSDIYLKGHTPLPALPPWLTRSLNCERPKDLSEGTLFGRLTCPRPSAIANGTAWWSILETLPIRLLSEQERLEYRFPYLDRDLVEFLFSVPRRQLVEPGHRRSLMRRAVKGIVPPKILERRRKAFLIKGPIDLIRRERNWLDFRLQSLRSSDLGLVDPKLVSIAVNSVANDGDPTWAAHLTRLVAFELFLDSAPIGLPQSLRTSTAPKLRTTLTT